MTLQASFQAELRTFRAEVEGYLAASGMKATTLGKEASADPNFVFDLRSGRTPRPETIDRVRAWMRERREAAA